MTRIDLARNLIDNAQRAARMEQYARGALIYSEVGNRATAYDANLAADAKTKAVKLFAAYLGHEGSVVVQSAGAQVTMAPEMSQAVRLFQRTSGVPQTGELDQPTLVAAAKVPVEPYVLSADALAPPPARVFSVAAFVSDATGAAVAELTRDQLVLVENGSPRDIIAVDRDQRPVFLAAVVDTSKGAGWSKRRFIAAALADVVRRLPAGSRCALFTTAPQPRLAVNFTDDCGRVASSIESAPIARGNALLDTLVAAARQLSGIHGRSVLLAITSSTAEVSHSDADAVVDAIAALPVVVATIQYEAEEAAVSTHKYDSVLSRLSALTGGSRDVFLTGMGVEQAIHSAGADLNRQYRVSYGTAAELVTRRARLTSRHRDLKLRHGHPFRSE